MKSFLLKYILSVPVLFLVISVDASAFTFKVATLSPDGSFWMQKLREGGEEIEIKTEGRVKFKFYPGGVMGKDKDVLRKIRLKQLHGAAVTGNTLNKIYPDMRLYNLVLKFRNLKEVDYVRDKMDAGLVAGLEEKGLVSFGFSEIGMAYIMSIKPVQKLDDMRSRKAWVPENNELALAALKAFSISPIPLPVRDVLMGLQTNMIDIVGGSPMAALALQWHTKVKFVTDMPLSYIFATLFIDEKAFKKISKEDQEVVRLVMNKTIKTLDKKSREDNISAKQAMIKQGIKFLKLTESAADEIRKTIVITNKKLEKDGNLSTEKMKTLNGLLSDFRKSNP